MSWFLPSGVVFPDGAIKVDITAPGAEIEIEVAPLHHAAVIAFYQSVIREDSQKRPVPDMEECVNKYLFKQVIEGWGQEQPAIGVIQVEIYLRYQKCSRLYILPVPA